LRIFVEKGTLGYFVYDNKKDSRMDILSSITNFFISSAYAADAPPAPPQGGGFSLMIMLIVFVGFMYFVVWRPQSKRAKEHRDLLNSVAKGDEVITAGGILGKVSKVTEGYVVIALADNVEITMQKSSIVSVLPKGTMKSI
jgi:preprotein translocase subunit YajC